MRTITSGSNNAFNEILGRNKYEIRAIQTITIILHITKWKALWI